MTTCDRCAERLPDNEYPHTCTPPDVEDAIAAVEQWVEKGYAVRGHPAVILKDALRAAQAENARLRSALETIDKRGTNGLGESWTRDGQIARAALASPAGGREETE